MSKLVKCFMHRWTNNEAGKSSEQPRRGLGKQSAIVNAHSVNNDVCRPTALCLYTRKCGWTTRFQLGTWGQVLNSWDQSVRLKAGRI